MSAARARASCAASSSRRRRGVESNASIRFVFSFVCMPTSTFSSAVMFWNRRMFWNVRPTARLDHVVRPRALEDPETRAADASTRAAGRSPGAESAMSRPIGSARARSRSRRARATRQAERRCTSDDAAGMNHRIGSSQRPNRSRDHLAAAEHDLARCRVDDAGDDVEERRLAGAVRADEADDRALGMTRSASCTATQAAESLGDVAGAQDPEQLGRRPVRLPARSPGPLVCVVSGVTSARRSCQAALGIEARRARPPSDRRPRPYAAPALSVYSGTDLQVAAASSPRARCRRAGTGTRRS